MPVRHLVLGGARSGKSRYAESLVAELAADDSLHGPREMVYVATGQAGDDEMAERIAHHREQRRGAGWTEVEEPVEVAAVLSGVGVEQVVLVDCLTLWLTNLYCDGGRDRWPEILADFLRAVDDCRADVVLVSNEVGLGVVPLGAETRWFVDEIGRLHQQLASVCTHVTLVAAGLPLSLKGPATS